MNKKIMFTAIIGAVLGVVFTVTTMNVFFSDDAGEQQAKSNEPLYWVAPMDANYKRDKPGKSPMGMDLVPVYKENNGSSDSPGTISIQPDIVNNLSVRTGKVVKSTLTHTIKTVGYIAYDQTSLSHIHPRTEGWIEQLFVNHNGQFIEQGQALYTLYSPTLVNAQEEYLLARKRNNSRLLRAAEQRLKALNFGAKEQQKIEQSGKASRNVTFYAQSSGVVDNLNIREGFYIKPGTRLMTIGELDTVWVEVEIFGRQLPFIKEGQEAKMELQYLPSKEWRGAVDYIYPIIDSTNRAAKIRLEFDNPKQLLKPNMFAEVTIFSESEEPVLQVPIESVIRTEESDRVVFSKGEGKFKSVEVKIGRVTQDSIEILSGLKEGDRIVLSGQFLIDSESSIESDFKRFSSSEPSSQEVPSATVKGVINSIDLDNNQVNISREAISKWSRGPATMNFSLSDSIDAEQLVLGSEITFTFEIRDGAFVVTQIDQQSMEHQHD